MINTSSRPTNSDLIGMSSFYEEKKQDFMELKKSNHIALTNL
jgi:hypothetical protein